MFQGFGFGMIPQVVKNLIILNALFFVSTLILGGFGIDLIDQLGMHLPGSPEFRPFQYVTHMFMHSISSPFHLLFNMLALYVFGAKLEMLWGPQKFLSYYFITGYGASFIYLLFVYFETVGLQADLLAMGFSELDLKNSIETRMGPQIDELVQYVNNYYRPMVGASGAVFGLLFGYGYIFPEDEINLFFLGPIKAKYIVAGYGALELYNGLQRDPSSSVAHFAHLGGILFGFLLILLWRRSNFGRN